MLLLKKSHATQPSPTPKSLSPASRARALEAQANFQSRLLRDNEQRIFHKEEQENVLRPTFKPQITPLASAISDKNKIQQKAKEKALLKI